MTKKIDTNNITEYGIKIVMDEEKIQKELNKKHTWLKDSCKTIDYYDVGKAFNGLDIFDKVQDKTNFKEQKQDIKKPFKLTRKYKISKDKDISKER